MRQCFGFHKWRAMKWGTDGALDCRECRRCRRFEIYAYGSFHRAPRSSFPDIARRALPSEAVPEEPDRP